MSATSSAVLDSSRRLVEHFGCSSDTVDIQTCLGSVPATDIMTAGVFRNESGGGDDSEEAGADGWYWLPVIDGGYTADPVIAEEPLDTLLSGYTLGCQQRRFQCRKRLKLLHQSKH